jgi:hypothetical protein
MKTLKVIWKLLGNDALLDFIVDLYIVLKDKKITDAEVDQIVDDLKPFVKRLVRGLNNG